MAFVNEELTEEERMEFAARGIKRPWSEYIAKPIYRTIDAERDVCLWHMGTLGRDFFDHHGFYFEWHGEGHIIIMEYINPGAEKGYIIWSVSEYEKNVIYDKPFAEDFREALIKYGINGRLDQGEDFTVKVDLKGKDGK